MFAQDPAFNDLDKELLADQRIEVLEMPKVEKGKELEMPKEMPKAWKMIGSNSLVFAPHFGPTGAPTGLFLTAEAQKKSEAQVEIESEKAKQELERLGYDTSNPYSRTPTPDYMANSKGMVFQDELPAIMICNDLSAKADSEGSPYLGGKYSAYDFPWYPATASSKAFSSMKVYTAKI